MKLKLKHGISLFVIAIFVFIAFASFGPDASTNTSVAIKDCEEKPPVSGQLTINVNLSVEAGDGDPKKVKAYGKLFIVHQKVNDNDACTYTSSSQTIDFETDFSGEYSYTGTPWTHDSNKDLFRIEILVQGSLFESHGPHKEIQVYYYDIPNVSFVKTLPGILSGE